MKYFFASIGQVLYCFLVASTVVANHANNDINGLEDDFSNVLVSMSGHKAAKLSLRRNGNLDYQDLPNVDISTALVREHEYATCFFWRRIENLSQYSWPGRFISRPFSSGNPLTSMFDHAERLYCYDHTKEQLNGNIFTLFVENGKGDKKLTRIEIPEDESYIELGPDEFGVELGIRSQIAVVASPVKKRYVRRDAPYHMPVCSFVLVDESEHPFRWLVSTRSIATLTLDRDVESVVCFRDIDDTKAVEAWLSSRYGE